MKQIKQETKIGIAFISVSFIGTSLFLLIPYIDVFRRSFFTAAGEIVGFENYIKIFQNDAFRLAMKNTFSFVAICIPLLLISSLVIAVFIYQNAQQVKWMKTGFLVPMAIPVSSVVLFWRLVFDKRGFLNGALQIFGFESVDWMNTEFAFWVLIISYIWKNLGYNIILWIAGLSTISTDIYEAAKVDGASSWQCFHRLTLPNLMPSLFIISVLALINSFKIFREAYLVAGEYPHESMYMIQHLFNNWFRDLSLDKMASGAVVNSIILIVLVLLLQRFWDKRSETS